jgi:hypothetical protein
LPKNDGTTELFKRLRESRRWVGAMFGWMLLWTVVHRSLIRIPDDLSWRLWLIVPLTLILLIAALVLQAVMLRSLLNDGGKPVRLIWGVLAQLLWIILAVVAFALLASLHIVVLQLLLEWMVVPAVFLPFVASSTVRGLRLPWRRVLRVLREWRWWLGVLLAALAWALVSLFVTALVAIQTWVAELKLGVANLLQMGIWLLLMGWFAVLFDRHPPPEEEQLLSLGVAGPEDKGQQDSVKLPLPESR